MLISPPYRALVVQWIGHSPAKGEMQVRFLPRAQTSGVGVCPRERWEHFRAGIEDPEHIFERYHAKKCEGCTETVSFDKRTRDPPGGLKTLNIFLSVTTPKNALDFHTPLTI